MCSGRVGRLHVSFGSLGILVPRADGGRAGVKRKVPTSYAITASIALCLTTVVAAEFFVSVHHPAKGSKPQSPYTSILRLTGRHARLHYVRLSNKHFIFDIKSLMYQRQATPYAGTRNPLVTLQRKVRRL